MIRTLLATGVLTLGTAFAQNCNFNQYPIHLVDSLGVPMPKTGDVAQFPEADVYLAFDTSLPDGLHRFYIQITDQAITTVTTADAPENRVVDVLKTGTTITLSFPFAVTQPDLGLGLNGIGESVRIEFQRPQNQPGVPCSHKAWASTGWEADALTGLPVLANSPFVTGLGTYPNCRIASFQKFDVANCGTNPTPVCEGRTIGFWRNCHGRQLVNHYGILPTLPALNIVNLCGQRVSFSTTTGYANWLKRANSINMAYMLSAQLVAMHNNVTVGNVSPHCVVHTCQFGNITIGELMSRAVASLAAHPYTGWCHPARNYQKALKDALDRANNNNNNWASL